MLAMQPANITPWADTYESTATAFVEEATREPMFKGNTGIGRTLSLWVSVAWYEGRFDLHAKGDNGNSLCMFQVGRSNLRGLGISEEAILQDTKVCIDAARRMMKLSFRVCSGLPASDMLGHYASGGSKCGGLKASRNRMATADNLFVKLQREEVQ